MSQLNIDNIANQLGTGGPDFVGMPSVGGDPVVESGSNSDGYWTRWADGTQECYRPLDVISSGNWAAGTHKSATWTFPIPFSVNGYWASGVSHVNTGTNNSAQEFPVGVPGDVRTTTACRFTASNITSGSAPSAWLGVLHAFGRWK